MWLLPVTLILMGGGLLLVRYGLVPESWGDYWWAWLVIILGIGSGYRLDFLHRDRDDDAERPSERRHEAGATRAGPPAGDDAKSQTAPRGE